MENLYYYLQNNPEAKPMFKALYNKEFTVISHLPTIDAGRFNLNLIKERLKGDRSFIETFTKQNL